MNLNLKEQENHNKGLKACRVYKRAESEIILALIECDRTKLYLKFEHTVITRFATEVWGLPDAVAGSFVTVARKAAKFSVLRESLIRGDISVSKAQRFVSGLTSENEGEWITFAKVNSCQRINEKMADENPESKLHGKFLKHLPSRIQQKILRAQAIRCQDKSKTVSLEEIIEAMADLFLEKEDPLVKAKRAQEKANRLAAEQKCTYRKSVNGVDGSPESASEAATKNAAGASSKTQRSPAKPRKRKPLKAKTKHEVDLRDGGRCTYIDSKGHRCPNERFLHRHHIVPLSEGGSDEPSNLITLCGSHHDLVHQIQFEMNDRIFHAPQVEPVHWQSNPTHEVLAKYCVYVKDKTSEEICDEVLRVTDSQSIQETREAGAEP